jgi:hypothetical protein
LAEQQALTGERQQLVHHREKLLQAHYAGAIPLELLKTEQDRISDKLEVIDARLASGNTQHDVIEQNLRAALDLAADCGRAYRDAADPVRRLLNQALFERLYLGDEGASSDLAEPFRTLLGPDGLSLTEHHEVAKSAEPELDPTFRTRAQHRDYVTMITARRRRRPETSKPSAPVQRYEGLKESTVVHLMTGLLNY